MLNPIGTVTATENSSSATDDETVGAADEAVKYVVASWLFGSARVGSGLAEGNMLGISDGIDDGINDGRRLLCHPDEKAEGLTLVVGAAVGLEFDDLMSELEGDDDGSTLGDAEGIDDGNLLAGIL